MKLRLIAAAYLIFLGAGAFFFANPQYRKLLNFMSAIPHWDKYFHFCATGLLSFIVNAVLSFRSFKIGKVPILWGCLIVAFMSVSEEYSQTFIPGRVFDIWDIAAAVSGVVVWGYLGLYFHLHPGRRPSWLHRLLEHPAAELSEQWTAFRGAGIACRHWWRRRSGGGGGGEA